MANTSYRILNNVLKRELGLKCVLIGSSYDIVMEEIFLTDKAFEWELEKNSQSESYRIFNALAGHGKNLSVNKGKLCLETQPYYWKINVNNLANTYFAPVESPLREMLHYNDFNNSVTLTPITFTYGLDWEFRKI